MSTRNNQSGTNQSRTNQFRTELARTESSRIGQPRNGDRYKVLAYLRVSHARAEDNHTFETQRERIVEKLNRLYGADCYDMEVMEDDGLSGAYGPAATGVEKRIRKSLPVIEAKLCSGQYDCFAIYKLNRIFRSQRWVLQWLEDVILPSGVYFLSATEEFDVNTPAGRTFVSLMAMMDQSFRDSTVERNRDAIAMRAEQGYSLGPPPYGWEFVPADSVPPGGRRGIQRVPQEAEQVVLMKDLYLSGRNGIQIAGELNARGVPSSKGGRWSGGTVIDVLKNRLHAGYVHAKSKGWIVGQHYEQRLYEIEVVEEVLRTIERRNERWKTNTGKANSIHLLNGLVHCARCGRRLYMSTGTAAYRRYRCESGRSQGKRTCPEVTIQADWVEDAVVREIERLAQSPQMRQLLESEAQQLTAADDENARREKEQLTGALNIVHQRLERLTDKLLDNTIQDAQFRHANSRLLLEQQELESRIQTIEATLAASHDREAWAAQVQRAVLDFPLCWANLDLDERRQLLLTVIEDLTVDKIGRDAKIKLKLHLLPEQEVNLCYPSTRHMKERPVGVQGLTRRQLVFLYYAGRGKTHAEIARLMGTTIYCAYQYALQVRRALDIQDLSSAFSMARSRIESLLPQLPLGPTGYCTVHTREIKELPAVLMEVFPLLARGASCAEVARLTSLSVPAVNSRRARILDYFEVSTIFEAGERARQMGLLRS
jgi:site-specific DNA recombinase